MNFKNLSPNQVEALDDLARDHPFGMDRRTENGLRRRGILVDQYWNELFPVVAGFRHGAREKWAAIRQKEAGL